MIRLALTTFANPDDATRVARTLVTERLAACGTILPSARSIYWWKESIEEAEETAVLFKVPDEIYDSFRRRLDELHPYDTPEIIALDSADVSPAYLAWARDACKGKGSLTKS